ncbi:MAG TPA: hypothetical protein VJJ82_00870, partial [Candidatus Nanoarchaeia archaeon]|nr:hypothetical protein [Candidatus Nanoarchaeia archaeon]
MSDNGRIVIVDASPSNSHDFFKRLAQLCEADYVVAESAGLGMFVPAYILRSDAKTTKPIKVPVSMNCRDVFVTQSGEGDIVHRIHELEQTISAVLTYSPRRVALVMPYSLSGTDIARNSQGHSKPLDTLVRRLKNNFEIDRVFMTGLHNEGILAAFNSVGDSAPGLPVSYVRFEPLVAYYALRFASENVPLAIAGPDLKMMERLQEIGHDIATARQNVQYSIVGCDLTRESDGSVTVRSVLGEVKSRRVILYDDEARSLGTVRAVLERFKAEGAESAYVIISHCRLNDFAKDNLAAICDDSFVKEVVFGDAIPLPSFASAYAKVRPISLAEPFAEAV